MLSFRNTKQTSKNVADTTFNLKKTVCPKNVSMRHWVKLKLTFPDELWLVIWRAGFKSIPYKMKSKLPVQSSFMLCYKNEAIHAICVNYKVNPKTIPLAVIILFFTWQNMNLFVKCRKLMILSFNNAHSGQILTFMLFCG